MNPLFNILGGGNAQQNNMIQQFGQFMRMMQGRDPQAEVNALLQSGRINQQQLNQIQQQAQQMQHLFTPFFK